MRSRQRAAERDVGAGGPARGREGGRPCTPPPRGERSWAQLTGFVMSGQPDAVCRPAPDADADSEAAGCARRCERRLAAWSSGAREARRKAACRFYDGRAGDIPARSSLALGLPSSSPAPSLPSSFSRADRSALRFCLRAARVAEEHPLARSFVVGPTFVYANKARLCTVRSACQKATHSSPRWLSLGGGQQCIDFEQVLPDRIPISQMTTVSGPRARTLAPAPAPAPASRAGGARRAFGTSTRPATAVTAPPQCKHLADTCDGRAGWGDNYAGRCALAASIVRCICSRHEPLPESLVVAREHVD
ncbi:uncharacterized protein GBIM_16185 [Gryllus bimaculatus]|nr:uncharacterized protein GBIM_16185 [Gryllus bimaculatus]